MVLAAAPAAAVAGTRWSFEAVKAEPEDSGAGGVGMVLDGTGGKVVVARVVPGGPAASAGIRAGDRIVAIAGEALGDGTTVAFVAGKVRGRVGSSVVLTVAADGAAARDVTVTRAAMSALFPTRIARPVQIAPGVALVATADQHTIGVLFEARGAPDAPLRYQWAMAPVGRRLGGPGAVRGSGVVAWTAAGATIQVAEWRLDLEPWPERSTLVAARSTSPVVVTDAATWLSLDPAATRATTLRSPPKPTAPHWPDGPCALALVPTLAGQAQPHRRLSVELRNDEGRTLPAETAVTDEAGVATLRLPAAEWTVTQLLPSAGGGGRDLAYVARLEAAVTAGRCGAGSPVRLTLPLAPVVEEPATALPPAALTHPLVGKPMPAIAVRRWLGEAAQAPTEGGALLLYAFATWCGPCKRVSPDIAELSARAQGEGLRVVIASADRDEVALEDYADDLPRGGPPIAWCGPDLLDAIGASGIPTVIAVDGQGIVRAVHTGTGVALASWQAAMAAIVRGEPPVAPAVQDAPAPGASAPAKPAGDAGRGVADSKAAASGSGEAKGAKARAKPPSAKAKRAKAAPAPRGKRKR